MIGYAINYGTFFNEVTGWAGLDVAGFATLMGVLFVLITLVEILVAIYDRKKENKIPQAKHTSIVDWGLAKFFHLKPTAKV